MNDAGVTRRQSHVMRGAYLAGGRKRISVSGSTRVGLPSGLISDEETHFSIVLSLRSRRKDSLVWLSALLIFLEGFRPTPTSQFGDGAASAEVFLV